MNSYTAKSEFRYFDCNATHPVRRASGGTMQTAMKVTTPKARVILTLTAPGIRSTKVASIVVPAYKPVMPEKSETTADNLLIAVGNRIRDIREAKQIAQKDFAKAAGFSLQYLWRLENGSQNLNLKSISRISLALDIPMAALFEGIAPDPATIGVRPYRRKAAPDV